MIFRRTKHRLPKFPPDAIPMFKAMCEVVKDEAELNKLKEALEYALTEIEDKAGKHHLLDVSLARQLADRCRLLLDRYAESPPKLQALIIGAVRYFAVGDDPMDDATFAAGLNDDVKIVNHVLEKLGMEEDCMRLR